MIALITGASSGIGKSIAKELSNLGYDLCVVARNKKKLNNIYKNYKTKVEIIEIDLSKPDNCYLLYDKVKNKKIDILVNNAGFGDCGKFNETNLDKELEMINVNIIAYHILTKLFIKDFIKRDYGRILNIASFAGTMPGPYMATYYATKSYILNLSLAISEELKQQKTNAKISVFCPGPVKTNFNTRANVHFNINSLTSEEASNCAIEGMFKNKVLIIPNNMKINYILTKISPINLILKINSKVQEKTTN